MEDIPRLHPNKKAMVDNCMHQKRNKPKELL